MKFLIAIIIGLSLMGCESTTSTASNSAEETCKNFGYRIGTSKYENCLYMQKARDENSNTKIIREYTRTGAESSEADY